jgi:hypothetical protein
MKRGTPVRTPRTHSRSQLPDHEGRSGRGRGSQNTKAKLGGQPECAGGSIERAEENLGAPTTAPPAPGSWPETTSHTMLNAGPDDHSIRSVAWYRICRRAHGRWLAGRVSPNTDVRRKGRRPCESFQAVPRKARPLLVFDLGYGLSALRSTLQLFHCMDALTMQFGGMKSYIVCASIC